jgi:hypothetical protein
VFQAISRMGNLFAKKDTSLYIVGEVACKQSECIVKNHGRNETKICLKNPEFTTEKPQDLSISCKNLCVNDGDKDVPDLQYFFVPCDEAEDFCNNTLTLRNQNKTIMVMLEGIKTRDDQYQSLRVVQYQVVSLNRNKLQTRTNNTNNIGIVYGVIDDHIKMKSQCNFGFVSHVSVSSTNI